MMRAFGTGAPTNPFSSHRHGPGRMRFHFLVATSRSEMVERMDSLGWRAECIGPMGSGKSTLLHEFRDELESRGWTVAYAWFREDAPWISLRFLRESLGARVLIVDGAERRHRWWRWALCVVTQLRGQGLLFSAHEPLGLLPLISVQVTPATAGTLLRMLVPEREFSEAGLAERLGQHSGNFRLLLRELYDEHEAEHRSRIPA